MVVIAVIVGDSRGGEGCDKKKKPVWTPLSIKLHMLIHLLQVACAVALMEAVRCEQGVGVFSSGLYAQLVCVLGTARGVHPEVFTLLFSRYFHHAGRDGRTRTK